MPCNKANSPFRLALISKLYIVFIFHFKTTFAKITKLNILDLKEFNCILRMEHQSIITLPDHSVPKGTKSTDFFTCGYANTVQSVQTKSNHKLYKCHLGPYVTMKQHK